MRYYRSQIWLFFKSTCILLVMSFACTRISLAQDTLNYTFVESERDTFARTFITENISTELNAFIDSLAQEGYWNASLDSFNVDNKSAFFYKGNQFDRLKINRGNLNEEVYKALKIQKAKKPEDWPIIGNRLSNYLGDNGFPFAKIKLDSFDITDNTIDASIHLVTGPKIKFDSIYVDGNVNVSNNYLRHYLGFNKITYYDHSKILTVEKLLKALPFVKIKKSPEIKFLGEYASLHLNLEKKNASRFDFLIGVNPLQEDGGRRFFITLDIEAEMINQLGYGEMIGIRFARLKPDNQQLEFKLRYPYPLNLPIAINGSFALFRNSLNYQDILSEAGVLYMLGSQDNIGISWDYNSSRLINIDSTNIVNSRRLPEALDVVKNGLVISGLKRNLDNIWNPSKGWGISGNVKFNTKTILENNAIKELRSSEVDFSNSYDTLNVNGIFIAGQIKFDHYLKLGQNFSLNSSINVYHSYSDIKLYDNELRRIGGNQVLRGFDEESFMAETYLIPGLALNLRLDEQSFLSLPFVEYGYFKNENGDWKQAIGVGAGINIQTKVGLLNFSIASGKFDNQSFDFSNPKVHIGFISVF